MASILILTLTSCSNIGKSAPTDTPISTPVTSVQPAEQPISELTVHFIDVGQADAAILQYEDDTMIIDGGNVADSKAYQTFKQKVADQNSEIMHPVNYEIFPLGSARVEILASPTSEDNLNNTSIILKVTHGNKSFLFTGDAEREKEQMLLDRGLLKSNVLKVGHHGSDTSTSYTFLREVMPEYAVISVGKDNSYGHPTEAVLSRLSDADVKIYRTDLQGDIIMSSDGENITVTTAKNENIQTNETAVEYGERIYILATRTQKSCIDLIAVRFRQRKIELSLRAARTL